MNLLLCTTLLLILFLTEESKNYIAKSSKNIQSNQNISTKLTKIREHTLNESTCSNLREYEGATLSSQNLLRHHEDSGIEISSMKKDDNLEGEDFLERARKVSLIKFANVIVMKKLLALTLDWLFSFQILVCHILTCARYLICVWNDSYLSKCFLSFVLLLVY